MRHTSLDWDLASSGCMNLHRLGGGSGKLELSPVSPTQAGMVMRGTLDRACNNDGILLKKSNMQIISQTDAIT